jgi:hypothetical protein
VSIVSNSSPVAASRSRRASGAGGQYRADFVGASLRSMQHRDQLVGRVDRHEQRTAHPVVVGRARPRRAGGLPRGCEAARPGYDRGTRPAEAQHNGPQPAEHTLLGKTVSLGPSPQPGGRVGVQPVLDGLRFAGGHGRSRTPCRRQDAPQQRGLVDGREQRSPVLGGDRLLAQRPAVRLRQPHEWQRGTHVHLGGRLAVAQ